jgi:hypothetical protein
MDNNSQKINTNQSQIQIELSDETAQGTYANLVVIAHSASEFIFDFIRLVPGTPKAKVQSRIILTPDNAKRLLFALQDNLQKFEDAAKNNFVSKNNFGDILPPVGMPGQA